MPQEPNSDYDFDIHVDPSCLDEDSLSQLGDIDKTEGSIGTQDDYRTEYAETQQSDDEVLPSIETDEEEDDDPRESRPESSASQRSSDPLAEDPDHSTTDDILAQMEKEQSQARAGSSRTPSEVDNAETKSHSSRAGRAAAADDASSHHTDEDVFSDKSPRSSLGSYDMGSESGKGHHDYSDNMTSVAGRSPRVSDISQYDKEDFVPTIRGTPRPAFRTPSDVRAMQMASPAQSVVNGGGNSPRSSRRYMPTASRLGTPTASAQYSPKRTPDRLKPRKEEAPLVLLHCTLLPLRWVWGPLIGAVDAADMSQDVKALRDAWRVLQDRMGDTTCERGILLGHPQSDYEVLEERLLEALELPLRRRARILECGHYLGPSNEMLGYDDDDDDESCLDSEEGHGYYHDEDDDGASSRRRSVASKTSNAANNNHRKDRRHWCGTCRDEIRYESLGPGKVFRVKVYASNGLMKAGAWEACWKEMERVDVEIEPIVAPAAQDELVRLAAAREEEADIAHEVAQQFREEKKAARKLEREDRHKDGRNSTGRGKRDMRARVDDVADGESELEAGEDEGEREPTPEPHRDAYADAPDPYASTPPHPGGAYGSESAGSSRRKKLDGASFPELLLESARVLLQDRKNLAILALSVFVLVLAVRTAKRELPYEHSFSGLVANVPRMRHVPAVDPEQAPFPRDVTEQDVLVAEDTQSTGLEQSEEPAPEALADLGTQDLENVQAAHDESMPDENPAASVEEVPAQECDEQAASGPVGELGEGADAELIEDASVPSERELVDAAPTVTQDASSGYNACVTDSATHEKAVPPVVSEAPNYAEAEVEFVTEKKTVKIVETVTETETQFECLRVTATEFIQLAEPTSYAIELLDALSKKGIVDTDVDADADVDSVAEATGSKADCNVEATSVPEIDVDDELEEPALAALDFEDEF